MKAFFLLGLPIDPPSHKIKPDLYLKFERMKHNSTKKTNESLAQLIFVYNADSGFFNRLSDWTHKAVSPGTYSCSLCSLTHHNFGKKKEWEDYLKKLPFHVTFQYRNDFLSSENTNENYDFPVVLLKEGKEFQVLVSRLDLQYTADSYELMELLNQKISKI